MNDEELFSNDYRETAECKTLLKQIEAVITKAGTARSRYINQRVTVPKKWSLEDIIAVSEKVEVVKGYIDVYTAKDAKKGLPKPDAFQVSVTQPKTADWV